MNKYLYLGSGKQLQCLLNMGKSVTTQCQNMLKQRQELWGQVSLIFYSKLFH